MTKTLENSNNLIDPQNGMVTTKYDRLGKKIDELFPLLDPELDLPTAITRHKESSNAKN